MARRTDNAVAASAMTMAKRPKLSTTTICEKAVRPWFQRAPLKPDDMRSLLIRMNYLRYRAARRRDALDRYEPRVADLDQIDADLRQAAQLRDRLALRCLPLVLSIRFFQRRLAV